MSPTLLEVRYRRALRMLDARGADGSDTETAVLAGLGKPGPAEVVSVLLQAVRARLGAFGATPRQARWGDPGAR